MTYMNDIYKDDIIEELHILREKYAEKFNFQIWEIFKDLSDLKIEDVFSTVEVNNTKLDENKLLTTT